MDKIVIELKELRFIYRIASYFDFVPEPSPSNIIYILENISSEYNHEEIRLLLWNYEGFSMDSLTDKILGLIDQL